ncbi:MAG: hypothetical protein CVU63_12025, partial [Deltaproteobacteria bacterium HGW-Deltaproteobacteria-20]
YTYERGNDTSTIAFDMAATPDRFSVRFGPFPVTATFEEATLDSVPVPFTVQDSGDSRWVWVETSGVGQGTFAVGGKKRS